MMRIDESSIVRPILIENCELQNRVEITLEAHHWVISKAFKELFPVRPIHTVIARAART